MKALTLSLVVLLIIVGLFVGTNYVLNSKSTTNNSLQALLPIIKKPVSFDLELTNPDDQIISFQSSLVVSGTTSPNIPVIISTDTDDAEVDSDANGTFSKAVSLTSGLNHIFITAVDTDGSKKEIDREVYYSKDQL